ncbi:putative NSs [Brazoran virus]|uniref:Non-structural protein NS-S n=1 Tax=Brazoran virus TaxID=1368616 RepID=S5XAL3_9VIRU|nr:putative NSs [Brazoran virus]AGS94384.1 putative NSs [Brazoran virus]
MFESYIQLYPIVQTCPYRSLRVLTLLTINQGTLNLFLILDRHTKCLSVLTDKGYRTSVRYVSSCLRLDNVSLRCVKRGYHKLILALEHWYFRWLIAIIPTSGRIVSLGQHSPFDVCPGSLPCTSCSSTKFPLPTELSSKELSLIQLQEQKILTGTSGISYIYRSCQEQNSTS